MQLVLNKYGMVVYGRVEYEQRYLYEANTSLFFRPEPYLIVSSTSTVFRIDLNGSNYRVLVDTLPSTTNVDYHLRYIQIIANPILLISTKCYEVD